MSEAPIIKAEAVRGHSGIWTLKVPSCPFCGKPHCHGGGDGDKPYYGSRLSHCHDTIVRRRIGKRMHSVVVKAEPHDYILVA